MYMSKRKIFQKNMSRFTKNQNRWDSIDSTYEWDIKLKDRFTPLRGYSKGLNLPEMQDKSQLLIKNILRIWLNSKYHTKSEFMEIRKRDIFGTNHDVVVTLFPFHYELEPIMLGDRAVEQFLEKAYEYIKTGEQPDMMIKVPEKQKFTEMNKTKHFVDKKDLWNYCSHKLKEGAFPKGQVEAYYREMCEKFDFDGRFKRDNQDRNQKIDYQTPKTQTQPQTQASSAAETNEFRRTPKLTTNSQGRVQTPEIEKAPEKTWIENYRDEKFKQLYTLYFKFNYVNMDAVVKQTINKSFDNAQNKAELDDYFEQYSSLIISKKIR